MEYIVVPLLAVFAEEGFHGIFHFVLNGEIRPTTRPEVEGNIGILLGTRKKSTCSTSLLEERSMFNPCRLPDLLLVSWRLDEEIEV